MSITLRDLLKEDQFKGFQLIAGAKGIDKRISGVVGIGTPDWYVHIKGDELIYTSGFVLNECPEALREAIQNGKIQGLAGFILRNSTEAQAVAEKWKGAFERYDVPLILMPTSLTLAEFGRKLTLKVMDRIIDRFQMTSSIPYTAMDENYKIKKIRRIIRALEQELNMPVVFIDRNDGTHYYSSGKFRLQAEKLGISEADCFYPPEGSEETDLSEFMKSISFHSKDEEAKVSVRQISIGLDNVIYADMIVLAGRNELTVFDEYTLRFAYMNLQFFYEQVIMARNFGFIGFENFIKYVLRQKNPDRSRVMQIASSQGISVEPFYYYTVFRAEGADLGNEAVRITLLDVFHETGLTGRCIEVFLDERDGLILFEEKFLKGFHTDRERSASVRDLLDSYRASAEKKLEGASFCFGFYEKARKLIDVQSCISKCRKIVEIGKRLYPKSTFFDYSSVGALTWLEIPDEELEELLGWYREYAKDKKNRELLRTLKIYLESNMNYSITADQMYVHINTIRKRIDKISRVIPADLESPVGRLKLDLLLYYLELEDS